MSANLQDTTFSRFIINKQWATATQIKEWSEEFAKNGGTLFSYFLQKKPKELSESELAQEMANRFSIPFLSLSFIDPTQLKIDILEQKFIAKHRILPTWQKDGMTAVLISDPNQLNETMKDLKFLLPGRIVAIFVEHTPFQKFLDKILSDSDTSGQSLLGDFDLDGLISSADDDAPAPTESQTDDVDDAPIVKLVNKLLFDAIKDGASDLHFEPYEFSYRVRFRRDGILYEHTSLPNILKEKIASRVKVMSKLDISEKRIPQDGRMKMKLDGQGNRAIDFRVSTLPTLFGEKIVMRILDPSSAKLGIEALGYEPFQKEILLNAVARPYGMVLVTGPTGSGKTVSLYTCLNILNTDGVNISTAEDPAEINLPGVNQVNVNDKAGLSFSAALKSFLRQDPDVIMVGEIRDLETADIAIKAAQTGHMVLSTLHTNDAPTTLTRLVNMGVAPFNIASSVILITAQRLARKLCSCKTGIEYTPEALKAAGYTQDQIQGYGGTWKLYGPKGCEICKDSGYKGRVGIYQVMPISERIQEVVLAGKQALDIARIAKDEGVPNLREAGLLKAMAGFTSLEEVLAVTNE
jgi:type IV pilus assembly protein PilB